MSAENTRKIEILAPAGSPQSVTAAVRCGADAVYLGVHGFNARQNAENFSLSQLESAIAYCHACGVRVHITLNTLVRDDELEKVKEIVKHVCRLGADVLILQDIGLAALVKDCAPDIERHASTQMSLQTADGIELARRWGFSTAVLPREMSRQELRRLRKETDIRLEVFIHGALCMCVSGQCYFSAMLGGRSGNRGLCAQPCRLPFSAGGSDRAGHSLSLKDLSLVNKAEELAGIGIDSLKIEGRMKRPEYVAAAVTAVRAALDGGGSGEINDALAAVFSRSGFTDGYYENRRTKDMFGTRTKQDVASATEKLLSRLQSLYDKEAPRVGVKLALTVLEGKRPRLLASAAGKSVEVISDTVTERAQSKPSTKQTLSRQLARCGGTIFYAEAITVDMEDNLCVPLSAVNALRRLALEKLAMELSAVKPKTFTEVPIVIPPHKAASKKKLHLRLSDPDTIPDDLSDVENLYFPLGVEENYVENVKKLSINVGIELPRGLMGCIDRVKKQLCKAKELGITTAYCGTLDGIALALSYGFEVHAGFSVNIFNSLSIHELELMGVKSATLSPELTLKQASKIGFDIKRGLIAYGRLPLMLTRNCPMQNAGGCKSCGGEGYLTDRKSVRFPVVCSGGFSEILNSRPIYMADKLDDMKNIDFITLYFTRESKSEINSIIKAYQTGRPPTENFTRGLYYRGV